MLALHLPLTIDQLLFPQESHKSQACKKDLDEHQKKVGRIFNACQLRALSRRSTRGMFWDDETVEKGMKLRSECGWSGYDLLLTQGYPLPTLRTMDRYIKKTGASWPKPSVRPYHQAKTVASIHQAYLARKANSADSGIPTSVSPTRVTYPNTSTNSFAFGNSITSANSLPLANSTARVTNSNHPLIIRGPSSTTALPESCSMAEAIPSSSVVESSGYAMEGSSNTVTIISGNACNSVTVPEGSVVVENFVTVPCTSETGSGSARSLLHTSFRQ